MGLDHRARGVRDVEAHELDPPFADATYGLSIVYDVLEAAGGHDHHQVAIEKVSKLALGDEHDVEKFLNLQVAGLQIREDLANKVHQALDFEGVALLLPSYD